MNTLSRSRASLSDVHPFDPAVLEEPWEYYRRLRHEAPVFRDPHTGIVSVATYDEVLQALRQPEVFSSRFGHAMRGEQPDHPEIAAILAQGFRPVDTLLTVDPPEHKRFRGLVNKAFTARRVNRLEPAVQEVADGLIDGFVADRRFEVLGQFSVPLPLTVIATQLGVPTADLDKFRRWTEGFTAQLGGMAGIEGEIQAARQIVEFQHYFAEKLEEARRAPRDDIISDLVRARLEGERPLDVPESLSILQQLLVAGNETTASAIAEGVLLLIQNPDQLALVRQEPNRIPNLVEEILRLATPAASMWRVAAVDTELDGVRIRAGSLVLLRYASANRDEKKFPDPDRFDVSRENAIDHVSFGHGTHFCIGAMLARKEMIVAFRTLLARLASWRLAPDQRLAYKPSKLLRGLVELHVEFDPA